MIQRRTLSTCVSSSASSPVRPTRCDVASWSSWTRLGGTISSPINCTPPSTLSSRQTPPPNLSRFSAQHRPTRSDKSFHMQCLRATSPTRRHGCGLEELSYSLRGATVGVGCISRRHAVSPRSAPRLATTSAPAHPPPQLPGSSNRRRILAKQRRRPHQHLAAPPHSIVTSWSNSQTHRNAGLLCRCPLPPEP